LAADDELREAVGGDGLGEFGYGGVAGEGACDDGGEVWG